MRSYLREYINDSEFRMLILKNRIDIINYESIDHFDDFKIMVSNADLKVTITGTDLAISKMLDNELLVIGNIKDISMGEV